MKIGELAQRTGIPTRMLRYYEQQGLLASDRADNGYRAYRESDVERAREVRGLIQSGLTTRMARVVLDLQEQCDRATPPQCTRALAEELAEEFAALQTRIDCLTRSRDAVARFLSTTRHGDLLDQRAAASA